MRTNLIHTFLFALLISSLSLWAQDVISTDTLSFDSIPSDPEWYIAPKIPAAVRAPKRATAESCLLDSALNYNIDSVLIGITFYTYDEQGRTINTTGWSCLSDGTRIGWAKHDYAYSGVYKTLDASYDWDHELNTWKGVEKTEWVYEGNKLISTTSFDWLNGDWSATDQYTYSYDEAGRENAYVYYSRNATTLQLAPSRGRFRIWHNDSQMKQDIQYSSHNGTTWSAGTKADFVYDAQGNQIEYTYCSSYSGGNWIYSTHENWTYNAAKLKTYYKKQTWSSQWVTSNEEFYDYNAAGKYLLIEKYALKSGTLQGSTKQKYEYNDAGLQTSLIAYKWSNSNKTWVNNTWKVTGYDDANNTTETCSYTWKNDRWIGSGQRVLKTFNAKKKVTEQITQTWPTNATDWVNQSRITASYNAQSQKTQEITEAWQNNAWAGSVRIDWHFNAAKKNDTITVLLPNGTNWINSTRTVHAYDAKGDTLSTLYADWDGATWVMVATRRHDRIYSGANLLSHSLWVCEADAVWSGVEKDSTKYSSTGKTIFTAHYAWENGDWLMQNKVETTYDASDRQHTQERYEWDGTILQGKHRSETVYDAQGREILSASYNKWNSTTGAWAGHSKAERTYADGKVATLTLFGWGTDDWVPANRFSYTYDAAGNEILQIAERCTNGSWSNVNKYEKKYRGDEQIWDNTYQWLNGQWKFVSREESYYDEDAQAKLRRVINGTWENGELTTFSDFHYVYACDPGYYTIRFVNDDGSELASDRLLEGTMPEYKGEDPQKEPSDQYTYIFNGWDKTIVAATENATYTATYKTMVNTYTVTWLNDDGTEISHETLAYGATPVHTDPTKESTAQYTYTFAGWTPAIQPVTKDATYTATYTSTVNTYTITWLNEDGSELSHETLEYGATPTHDAPVKESTAQYTYTFAGWTPAIQPVTGDATYTATFSSTVNTYTITWLNEDGSELSHETLEYGAFPSHDDPIKESTAEYTYTFIGWKPEVSAVTKDATYTATFDSVKNTYTITWLNDDGSELSRETLEYGAEPIYHGAEPTKEPDGQYIYTFEGWTPDVEPVTGDATYTATFTATSCGDYPLLPVVDLYDWLLMLDVRSARAMGYVFSEEDVTWYRVQGEPDKMSDGATADDVRVGTGYSFTLNESLANTGDYYAMVDVSSSSTGVPCTGMVRSNMIHCTASSGMFTPVLTPTLVQPGEPQQVIGLNPDASTIMDVYDISGRLLRTVSGEGVDRLDVKAETVPGCYQVIVQNGNQRAILRYMVVQ